MDRPPDFFMSAAGEYEPLAAPRAYWQTARLRDRDYVRSDHMIVDIAPAVGNQRFDRATDITQLIISSRHRGHTLYPISEWPFFVYVARIVDMTVLNSHVFTREQVELVAWGTLFRARTEALDHAARFSLVLKRHPPSPPLGRQGRRRKIGQPRGKRR